MTGWLVGWLDKEVQVKLVKMSTNKDDVEQHMNRVREHYNNNIATSNNKKKNLKSNVSV